MATRYWTEKCGLTNWSEIREFVKRLSRKSQLIFRGQPHFKDDLSSSFDRAIRNVRGSGASIRSKDRQDAEVLMVYEFKRRAHHYLGASEVPERRDFLEWFSLMRHYGAPSRLVDFSYSFFVATYFAVNNTTGDAAVYCVDLDWLKDLVDKGASRLVQPGEFFQDPKVFWTYAIPHHDRPQVRRPFIIPVRSFRSNNRIHAQQGLFLCPANVKQTFDVNMRRMLGRPAHGRGHIWKIKVPRCLHSQIIQDLQAMNITSETLYPGLDGFAASIRDLLHFRRPLNEGLRKNLISEVPLL